VFTTPAIRALHRHFPDAQLTYLVEPAAAPVVAGNPHLGRVWVAPRAGWWSDLALGRRLRVERFDLALDFHGGPRASLLTWLSAARVRIGYDVSGRGWMYTCRVPRPRALRPRHSVRNQWDLLAPLGLEPPDPDADRVEMLVDPVAAAAVAARLAAAGVSDSDELVVVHVSAGNPFRRWPLEAFADLTGRLAARAADRRVVVTSGPSDRQAARRVVEAARRQLGSQLAARVVSCDEFSLPELRALADRAALYVGGDSGPLHIAAASDVPIVGLYGPTLPARSAPWRPSSLVAEAVAVEGLPCRPCDQRRCEPGDFRCLTRIHPSEVAEAAERALRRAAGRGTG
jgi:ADP-heptose:LPS heptosyltransferase